MFGKGSRRERNRLTQEADRAQPAGRALGGPVKLGKEGVPQARESRGRNLSFPTGLQASRHRGGGGPRPATETKAGPLQAR